MKTVACVFHIGEDVKKLAVIFGNKEEGLAWVRDCLTPENYIVEVWRVQLT